MTQYFDTILNSIENSIHSMDMSDFERLVNESIDTLRSGHRIIASGLGKNVPVCEKFVGTMNSLGLNAWYMNTNSAVHGDIGIVNEGDLVLLLTKSGETAESVYLADLLLARKANTWLITFTEGSVIEKKLGRDKCIILALDNEGDGWNIMPNNSTTINLIVIQGLAMMIKDNSDISLSDFKKNHPGGHIGVQLKDA